MEEKKSELDILHDYFKKVLNKNDYKKLNKLIELVREEEEQSCIDRSDEDD